MTAGPTSLAPTSFAAASDYPRENARTQRYTLGRPRTLTVSPDGQQVFFVRSAGGTDPVGRLYVLDVDTGTERQLADPLELQGSHIQDLPAEERARRERMRESAGGIVGYSIDSSASTAAFVLHDRLYVIDVATATARPLFVQTPIIDPRLSPDGAHVAYASRGELRLVDVTTGVDQALARPDGEHAVWGLADFVAAEELQRFRGFWWSPDSTQLLVERYDEGVVDTWWISDPTHPEVPPVAHRYPACGSVNAEVSLWLLDLTGAAMPVRWDTADYEYIASVHWSRRGRPLVQLLDRRQGRAAVLAIDETTGATEVLRLQTDPCWVDVVEGVPAWGPDGQLLTVEVVDGRYALCAEGVAATPAELQVRAVLGVDDGEVLLSAGTDSTEQHVWSWTPESTQPVTSVPGIHTAVSAGGCRAIVTASLADPLPSVVVHSADGRTWPIPSNAVVPALRPSPTLLTSHDHGLPIAVLLPSGYQPDDGPLPVLMDPYGGPHSLRVLKAQGAFRESQWFADQGFAVVVADGRGTPGDPRWERAVRGDLATAPLNDQVEALHAAATRFPQLDLTRVGIRGWSFGGYLAALAVLCEPDVFHAAVAGAPVTDWGLYDTAYSERYLGLPDENPEAYARTSLLPLAEQLVRPLMLIHGFSDDNVAVANTLQLSGRLMAAARPHTVLPLSGVTHMTPQEDVAENLLLLQVEFLRQALGIDTSLID